MFGIFYAAATAIGLAISGTKSAYEEWRCVEKGKDKRYQGKNRTNTYTDRHGHLRDIDTKESVRIDYRGVESEGKDQYLRNKYGDPIRNLSQERRLERYGEAKKDPNYKRTVVEWKHGVDDSRTRVKGNPLYSGPTYFDLSGNGEYVVRTFSFPDDFGEEGFGSYYMSVDTGMLVRETDGQIFDRHKHEYKISPKTNTRFIQYFNKRQKEGGYIEGSAISPRDNGWGTESEYAYRSRMGDFYCNQYQDRDVSAYILWGRDRK